MAEQTLQMDEREIALRRAIECALLYLIEMELAQEHIGPDSYVFIRRRLEQQHEEALEERRKDLTRLGPLPGAEDLHHGMEHVLEMLHQSCEAFCGSPRSEERRVGKECTSWCRSRWSPYH